jgi:hypothetical protein
MEQMKYSAGGANSPLDLIARRRALDDSAFQDIPSIRGTIRSLPCPQKHVIEFYPRPVQFLTSTEPVMPTPISIL